MEEVDELFGGECIGLFPACCDAKNAAACEGFDEAAASWDKIPGGYDDQAVPDGMDA